MPARLSRLTKLERELAERARRDGPDPREALLAALPPLAEGEVCGPLSPEESAAILAALEDGAARAMQRGGK